ncbi:hypothetical protein FH972_025388 [Carpinus fangiana]|uniref:Uncharacterized protein n=1 Tax=Carpinus fangiana TaxID=176857 RepID=A0A5N6L1A0_9ROSI|nr:hypothetical protein FH972_025388 [Carpinus fangiana]
MIIYDDLDLNAFVRSLRKCNQEQHRRKLAARFGALVLVQQRLVVIKKKLFVQNEDAAWIKEELE